MRLRFQTQPLVPISTRDEEQKLCEDRGVDKANAGTPGPTGLDRGPTCNTRLGALWLNMPLSDVKFLYQQDIYTIR